MHEPKANRVALLLPVDSPRHVVAAIQVAMFLIRRIGRTELDIEPAEGPPYGHAQDPGRVVLLASATLRSRVRNAVSRGALERIVRARVEREYARQGIVPVEYDLQVL